MFCSRTQARGVGLLASPRARYRESADPFPLYGSAAGSGLRTFLIARFAACPPQGNTSSAVPAVRLCRGG